MIRGIIVQEFSLVSCSKKNIFHILVIRKININLTFLFTKPDRSGLHLPKLF